MLIRRSRRRFSTFTSRPFVHPEQSHRSQTRRNDSSISVRTSSPSFKRRSFLVVIVELHTLLVFARTTKSSDRAPTLDRNTFRGRSVSSTLTFHQHIFFRSYVRVEGRTDEEKDRLANLMAYGVDPNQLALQRAEPSPSPPPEVDRFDECENSARRCVKNVTLSLCSGPRSRRTKTLSR